MNRLKNDVQVAKEIDNIVLKPCEIYLKRLSGSDSVSGDRFTWRIRKRRRFAVPSPPLPRLLLGFFLFFSRLESLVEQDKKNKLFFALGERLCRCVPVHKERRGMRSHRWMYYEAKESGNYVKEGKTFRSEENGNCELKTSAISSPYLLAFSSFVSTIRMKCEYSAALFSSFFFGPVLSFQRVGDSAHVLCFPARRISSHVRTTTTEYSA